MGRGPDDTGRGRGDGLSVLAGRVALVAGATSRGVGSAIADALADEGAAVVVNYLKSEGVAVH